MSRQIPLLKLLLVTLFTVSANIPPGHAQDKTVGYGATLIRFADTIATRGTREHVLLLQRLLETTSETIDATIPSETRLFPLQPEPHDITRLEDSINRLDRPEIKAAIEELSADLKRIDDGLHQQVLGAAMKFALTPKTPDSGQADPISQVFINTVSQIALPRDTRVYGGVKSNLAIVGALQTTLSSPSHCSATLVGRDRAITAAHCACYRKRPGTPVLPIRNMLLTNAPSERARRVHKTVMISGARCHDTLPNELFDYSQGDVAVLFISPVSENFRVSLTRESSASLLTGSDVSIVGYGRTRSGSTIMQWTVRMPVVSADCSDAISISLGCIPPLDGLPVDAFARDPERFKDACYGDSGGPVLTTDPLEKQEQRMIGVISRKAAGGGCGSGTVFTRIDGATQSWLDVQIASE